MKRILSIITLIIICTLKLYAQIQISISISTNEYSITNDHGYSRINYGYSFYTDSIGYPEIPVIHKSYAIPIDATDVSLQITDCTTNPLKGNCTLYPVQLPRINGSTDESDFVTPNPHIYNQTSPFPNIEAKIISDNKTMGFRIVEIVLYPFVYIPNSKMLYQRDISCTLNYSSETNQLFHAPKI